MADAPAPHVIRLRDALIALVLITVVFVCMIAVIVKIDGREERQDDQREVDAGYTGCLRGNELRAVIIENEREPNTTVLDLTLLPTVQRAPQWFVDVVTELRDLSAAAQAAPIDPTSRTGRRIANLEAQLRDCEAEYADHTPGLRLEPAPSTTTTGASP